MAVNFSKLDRLVDKAMAVGLGKLGNDVMKRAIILAPKLDGDLRGSAKVEVGTDDSVLVSFNTAYAKRRHYENNLHPATRLYLTHALKSIKRADMKRYFGGWL